MSPLVDVLFPTYKPNQAHLAEALRSLQAQEFCDWRALVHDDFSPESETKSIVEPFLRDSRITFVASAKRLGIGGNWNACIEKTSAPFVAFLFQDDLWTPDYLKQAIATLEKHPTIGFVSMHHTYQAEGAITNFPLYEEVNTFRKQHIETGVHDGQELLRFWIRRELHPNIIGEPSFVVMRRETMKQVGPFLEDMPQFLDTEYWQRLLQRSDWYFLKGKNFGSFRVHPAAASAVNQESGTGLFDRLRCFGRLIRTLTGDDRALAIQYRNQAIDAMTGKFFRRIGSGKKTSATGSSTLLCFCLRHPMLILRSISKHLLKK